MAFQEFSGPLSSLYFSSVQTFPLYRPDFTYFLYFMQLPVNFLGAWFLYRGECYKLPDKGSPSL